MHSEKDENKQKEVVFGCYYFLNKVDKENFTISTPYLCEVE